MKYLSPSDAPRVDGRTIDAREERRKVSDLEGKVAFITGAARGQGRSHAVELAKRGVDIIGIDICKQIEPVAYPMSTEEDLNETVRLVEGHGRTMISGIADVRDQQSMRTVLEQGVAQLGRLDIVIANAGVMFHGVPKELDDFAFQVALDVMLTGVWNTLRVSTPIMQEKGNGGSVVIISSTAGLKPAVAGTGGGNFGYASAKTALIGLGRMYSKVLGPDNIRVNTVHPTGVNTPMLVGFHEWAAEQLDGHARQGLSNMLPGVSTIEPIDVSNAIIWLVSETGRYVTGSQIPVDAGALQRG